MDLTPETAPVHIDPRAYAKIAFVGFGAIGQAVWIQKVNEIANQIEANPEAPPPLTEFQIYNEGCDTGHGQAYDLNSMALALNFPGQCNSDRYNVPPGVEPSEDVVAGMHLIEDQPNDFAQWLENKIKTFNEREAVVAEVIYEEHRAEGLSDLQIAHKDPKIYRAHKLSCGQDEGGWNKHSYLPRAFYKEYLKDKFIEACERIEAINAHYGYNVIKLNKAIDCYISDGYCEDGDMLCLQRSDMDGDPEGIIRADSIVVGTGHYHTEMFTKKVREHPRFANTPFHDTEIEEALGDHTGEDAKATIIGTGASYLDALRMLHVHDFKGQITAISGSVTHYWPFDPAKSGSPVNIDDFLPSVAQGDLKAVQQKILDTTHSDHILTIGPQNFFDALTARFDDVAPQLSVEDRAKLEGFVHKLAAHRTAPESYDVFREFLDNGQLNFVSARMNSTSYDEENTRWDIELNNGETAHADTLIDCAGLATAVVGRKGEIGDPFIRALVESGVAVIDQEKRLVTAAPEFKDRVAFVGVSGTNGRGIPYIRKDYAQVSRPVVGKSIERGQERMERLDIPQPPLAPQEQPEAACG